MNVRAAKVRTEASTSAELVTTLKRNASVVILEIVTGQKVSRSTVWYRVDVSGTEGYMHSSLLTAIAPTVPTGARSESSCPNTGATCSQLTCDQAYSCLQAGNGRLDRDSDGVPCESICPGG